MHVEYILLLNLIKKNQLLAKRTSLQSSAHVALIISFYAEGVARQATAFHIVQFEIIFIGVRWYMHKFHSLTFYHKCYLVTKTAVFVKCQNLKNNSV